MKGKFFFLSILMQLSVLVGYSSVAGRDYIVKQSQDTLYGRVEIMSDIEFRTVVNFHDQEGKMTSYSPGDVIAFYIEEDNRYFEFRVILLNNSPAEVFLRCLVKGEVSLFLFRDYEEANTFYYYQRGDFFSPLYNTKVQKSVKGTLYNTYNSEYLITLKNELVNICPGLLGSVDAVKYEEKALVGFIDKVNQCISPEGRSDIFLVKKNVNISPAISAGAGADKGWPAKGISFGVGFYQEVKMPELSRIIFISYGLELSYGFTAADTMSDRFSYQKVCLPVNLNIEIKGLEVTPYFLAGFSLIHYFDLQNKADENPPVGITGGTVFPLNIGCGIKVKRLNFIINANTYETRFKLAYHFR